MQSRTPSNEESILPGIPTQRTLALVNTYVVHTTRLLNEVAASVEQRLHKSRARINQLNVKLQLLEAKVGSAHSSSESAPAIEGSDRRVDGKHCEPSMVEPPESVAPSVRGGSEVDPDDDIDEELESADLGHAPSGFSAEKGSRSRQGESSKTGGAAKSKSASINDILRDTPSRLNTSIKR